MRVNRSGSSLAILALAFVVVGSAYADHKHGFVMVMNRTDQRHEISLFRGDGQLVGDFKCNARTDTTIKADCYDTVLVEIDNGPKRELGAFADYEDGHWHIRLETESHHHGSDPEPIR